MTLLEYLERHWFAEELFLEGDFTEITRHFYILLRRAILEQATEFTLSTNKFTWGKDNKLIGERLLSEPEVDNNAYKDALGKILERDKVIEKHLHLNSETPEEMTFSIVQLKE